MKIIPAFSVLFLPLLSGSASASVRVAAARAAAAKTAPTAAMRVPVLPGAIAQGLRLPLAAVSAQAALAPTQAASAQAVARVPAARVTAAAAVSAAVPARTAPAAATPVREDRAPAVRAALTELAAVKPAAGAMRFAAFYEGSSSRSPAPVTAHAAALRHDPFQRAGTDARSFDAAPEPKSPARFKYRRGMKSSELPGATPLEKHLAFFDTAGDGVLTLRRTFVRLRDLGFSWPEAAKTALGIQFGIRALLGDNAPRGVLARLTLQVNVKDAHLIGRKGTHHVFDGAGGIDGEKFRKLAAVSTRGGYRDRSGREQAGSYITRERMLALVAANAEAEDPGAAGRLGNRVEWELMFKHFSDGTVQEGGRSVPVMTVASLRKLYDGRLFYEKAAALETARSQARKRGR